MSLGIYDVKNRKSIASKTVSAEQANLSQYQVIDLGTHELTSDMYIWVAPPGRENEVESVLIDRIYLMKPTKS
jgi:hypothetical protein